jgi:hypothetical protein
MWEKLVWDVDIFADIQRSYPLERQPLAYAAINVCLAASSLRSWVLTDQKTSAKSHGRSFSEAEFWAEAHAAIPEQAMCEAIANTAKHSRHDETGWHGGEVRIEWDDGDEDIPPGWTLHYARGESSEHVALVAFQALANNWWHYLVKHRYASGPFHTPRWLNNKLATIFGDGPLYVGKDAG